jgi:hypothetical protein
MDYIPALDPLPIPGPPLLLHVLLVFTFVIHVLFMNMALGGTAIAAWSHFRDPKGKGGRLATEISQWNTYGIAFTVTTGIAPLLFLQVLYGQLFYSAAILLGGFWIASLAVLTAGYYSNFVHKQSKGRPMRVWLLVAGAGFILMGIALTTVNVLALRPDIWPDVAADRVKALSPSSLVPRFLHFFVGALAVAGYATTLIQIHKSRILGEGDGEETAYRSWAAGLGLRVARTMTAVELGVGVWFLVALPKRVMMGVMGGSTYAVVVFGAGMLLAIGLVISLYNLQDPMKERAKATAVGIHFLLVLVAMVMLRDAVRGVYLSGVFDPKDLIVESQWLVFFIFAALLAAALATVWWVVRRVIKEWDGRSASA